jgi:hypothetical protein
MTLVELTREYARDRERTDRTAKFLAIAAPPNTCRYCGKFWKQWAGSKLDGHTQCIVTPTFKHVVSVVLRSAKIRNQDVALALGVTTSVVRSWAFPTSQARRERLGNP